MKLYYSPKTISPAIAIALYEAGIEFSAQKIDFANAEQQSENYKKINPKARVPALETQGVTLSETGSMLEYIASLTPEKNLMPTDPLQRAQARQIMYYFASTMHINHAHKLRGYRWTKNQSSWDDMLAMVPETMNAACAYLEESIFSDEGIFLLGQDFSVVDCYFAAISQWLEGDGVNSAEYPSIARWQQAMAQRDSVKRVYAEGYFG